MLWHQNGAYWPLEAMEVVTLWLAVSDARPDNGGMRVIPRTQNMDIKHLRQRNDIENVLDSEMDGDVDETGAVDIVLQPGDVEVHHPNIVHGSNANTSDRWRKGLTIRYIPTTTRIVQPENQWPIWPMLMRGEAVPGINEYVHNPAYVEGEHMPFRDSHSYAAASTSPMPEAGYPKRCPIACPIPQARERLLAGRIIFDQARRWTPCCGGNGRRNQSTLLTRRRTCIRYAKCGTLCRPRELKLYNFKIALSRLLSILRLSPSAPVRGASRYSV